MATGGVRMSYYAAVRPRPQHTQDSELIVGRGSSGTARKENLQPPQQDDAAAEERTGTPDEVWRAVSLVPCGRVVTYGEVARALGGQWDPKAVGQALKQNPHAPHVPCHRVIRADRSLGGYFGGTRPEDPRMMAKVTLLEEEGVLLEAGDVLRVAGRSLWRYPKKPVVLESIKLPGEDGGLEAEVATTKPLVPSLDEQPAHRGRRWHPRQDAAPSLYSVGKDPGKAIGEPKLSSDDAPT
eukprot:TRINITY_DN19867_c0_g2_i3.p1 TRINITY_DN19867_c0_g2~~TRINITY_DN19867_c0_g2_i3.p1  ORF type:complete len:263 (+),score=23.70 TRINITY_DN19867_c0_g2_i3:75-791(+)